MKRKQLNFSMLLLLTVIVNILIPKAGIKVAGIPITIGSILLFCLLIKALIPQNKEIKYSITRYEFFILSCSFFWILIIICGLIFNGFYSDNSFYSIGRVFSYFIGLVICPLIVLCVNKELRSIEQIEYLLNWMYLCILIVLGYACLQYLLGIGTIQIPGVTVNLSDYLLSPNGWWRGKANAVSSDSSKIVSTYQNGNLFGANMLLLFPIVNKAVDKKNAIKYLGIGMLLFCSLVSGSRTFLFGVLFYLLLMIINGKKVSYISKNSFFSFILFGSALSFLSYRIIISGNDYITRFASIFNWQSLSNASNRAPKFQEYLSWVFERKDGIFHLIFGSFGMNHNGEAYEMLWGSVFIFGGIIGLVLFFTPIFYVMKKLKDNSYTKVSHGLFYGLSVYLFASIIEGAYWLLPTAINFWLVIAIGFRVNSIYNNS